ncbi:hypothetical protein Mgra_00008666 [Meloidogyne graminicola]|uniref:F-box domain-containing protein n=1 Tax=Meloidogyne graminicola TaxID=189291 RepID=A0A8S9ZF42_9BILA|nr:hypothetical protein Mgra_00008666 [Meloidogyne graminicola]
MKTLNLAEFINENNLKDLSDENKSSTIIEQKLNGILERAGPYINEINFNHSWPIISQSIIENIKEKCSQITKLELGWIRINADITPLLDIVYPLLEELSLEESSWNGQNSQENEAKIGPFLIKMKNLRRLNLRKFAGPLDDLAKIEGGKIEYIDVSEAKQINSDILVTFLSQNNQINSLYLCPMPNQCLALIAASTTSAINIPTAFIGFTQQKIKEKQNYKINNENNLIKIKKRKSADLQTLINQIGNMPKLKTLWIGHLPYTSYFLDLSSIGNCLQLKHLHLKECMALDSNSLKLILGGILKDQLRQLSLLNCQKIEDFNCLSICSSLIQLDIEKSKTLNDESINGLALNGKLKIIRINNCPKVKDCGILSIFSNCPTLKEIEIIKCSGISSQIFSDKKYFLNSEQIERISISGCETITNNSIKQLICAIKLNKLKQLDLSQNMNLDDTVLELIKEGIEKTKRETKLGLTVYCTGTGISKKYVKKFDELIEIIKIKFLQFYFSSIIIIFIKIIQKKKKKRIELKN